MEPLRAHALGKIAEVYNLPAASAKVKNTEISIQNWVYAHTANPEENASWENPEYRWRYKQRLLSILLNLKNNPDMIKKVKPKELETLTPGQMWPEGPRGQTEKKLREKENAMEMAKAKNDEEYAGILICPKCKSNKTSYYQLQTRSADEVSPSHQVTCPIVFFAPSKRRLTIRQPATNFCSCLCGHRWRFC